MESKVETDFFQQKPSLFGLYDNIHEYPSLEFAYKINLHPEAVKEEPDRTTQTIPRKTLSDQGTTITTQKTIKTTIKILNSSKEEPHPEKAQREIKKRLAGKNSKGNKNRNITGNYVKSFDNKNGWNSLTFNSFQIYEQQNALVPIENMVLN